MKSWTYIKGLHEERARLMASNAQFVDKAEVEKRGLTATEDVVFNSNMRRIEMIDAEIRATANEADKPKIDYQIPKLDAQEKSNSREVRALRSDEKTVDYFRSRGINLGSDVSAGAMIRSIVSGPQNNEEQRAISDGFRAPSSFLLPGFAVSRLLDNLRGMSAVLKAGASLVPLDSDRNSVAQVANDPTVTESAEGASTTVTTNNFVGVEFVPSVLRGIIAVSREMLQDAIAGDKTVEQAIVDAIAIELDQYCLAALDTSASLSVAAGGALASYDKLLDAHYQLASNNSKLTAAVMHPRESVALAKLKDSTNQPLRKPDSLQSVMFHDSTAVGINAGASIAYLGDWSKLIIGVRRDVELQVLQELYAANHRVGVAYSVRVDAVLARPSSICRITGITA